MMKTRYVYKPSTENNSSRGVDYEQMGVETYVKDIWLWKSSVSKLCSNLHICICVVQEYIK